MTEYEDEVVRHVLTYGYPSEDSDRWLVWHERGVHNARELARDTAAASTAEKRRPKKTGRRRHARG